MAAPPEVTLKALDGTYTMVPFFPRGSRITPLTPVRPQNKTLSDDPDPMLTLQGVGWLVRKAIGLATVTLEVKEYVDDEGKTHIDIGQTVTGGINASPEHRTLDWTVRAHKDGVFGNLEGKSRWATLTHVKADGTWDEAEWLCEDWEGSADEDHVQSFVENKESGWTAHQIWGFQTVNGERYYSRKVVVNKGGEIVKARYVYDFHGKKD